MALSYQITQKHSVVIVALVGSITRENLEALERLQADIAGRQFAWVVLHFKDVPERTDQIALPFLARIQKAIRDKGAQVRLSSLRPQLRQTMLERGLLRGDEYVEDLAQTLQILARAA
jgi:anti-anti-sigma regulatory factor